MVALLLEVNGFDTHDLGKDVESLKFVERAKEVQADIMVLSALMTTKACTEGGDGPSQRNGIAEEALSHYRRRTYNKRMG